jgi:Secretion system C-terminal sorting domain
VKIVFRFAVIFNLPNYLFFQISNMKKITTNLFLLAAMLLVGNLSAQVFWSEDFAGGSIPAGWVTTDGSNQGVLWDYCHQDSTCVNLFGNAAVATTTANNGLMVMDSDGNAAIDPATGDPGLLPTNHLSRLTTSAISCSGKPKVVLQFEMYFNTFDVDNKAKLRVSKDNLTFTDFTIPYILGSGAGDGQSSDNPYNAAIDISSVAANSSTVYIQWEYDGNWDYWFYLDDVKLTTLDPTPPLSLKISDFFYPLTHYQTPEFAIAKDTFGLSCNVSNVGSANQTAMIVKTWVYDDLQEVILFSDSIITAGLAVGVDSQFIFPKRFVPELPVGLYSVHYLCYVPGSGPDAIPADNKASFPFEVSDGAWALETGTTTAFRPGGAAADWAVGNVFYMLGGTFDDFVIGDVSWRAGGAAGAVNNKTAQVYVFEVDDSKVTPQWDGFDDTQVLSESFIWIGDYTYNYPATSTENYPTVSVVPNSFPNGDPTVKIAQGKRYVAAVSWEGVSNAVFHGFNDKMVYSPNGVNSIVFAGTWFLGGFQGDPIAQIRLNVSLSSTTDNQPLADAALSIFPNPTAELLNLEVRFEKATDATITLADATGKVISVEDKTGLTNETISYNISQYETGTYFARIATKEGTKTKQFVVIR